jgi:hypothetical protein
VVALFDGVVTRLGRVDMRGDELFSQPPDDADAAALKVCGRLAVVAETRDARGYAWGVLLHWRDREGREHQWAMPRAMLARDGAELRAHLLDGGRFLAPSRKARSVSWNTSTRRRRGAWCGWCRAWGSSIAQVWEWQRRFVALAAGPIFRFPGFPVAAASARS